MNIITAKDKTPEKCRIGGTCFTSVAIYGRNVFTCNYKKMNHVHKEHNDLVSETITLGVNVDGGDTILMMVYVNMIWVEELMCWRTLMEDLSLVYMIIFIMKVIFGEVLY